MIKVKLKTEILSELKDEIRFEIVKALTRTARDAVADIKADLPRKFVLRRNWIAKGIRFSAATKVNPVAKVYSLDSFMAKQEEGEVYRARGRSVAIPARGVRRNPGEVIPASLFPRSLKGNKAVFRADLPGIGLGLFQRSKREFKILYLLRARKTTRPHWNFEDLVQETVEKRFHINFEG